MAALSVQELQRHELEPEASLLAELPSPHPELGVGGDPATERKRRPVA